MDDDEEQELERLLALDDPTSEEFMAIAWLSMTPVMRQWVRSHDDHSTPFLRLLKSAPAADLEQPDAEHERG
jgi:hypothetical protein